jgi:sialate O-acetylesterase
VIRGKNTIELDDVLVGEVWICSGQSNMQWSIKQSADPEATAAAANHPRLRLFSVPRRGASEPQADVEGAWAVCTPESAGDFSAVGYHFGRHLQDALDVPIGLIGSNYGGTPAEAWTSRETLAASETLRPILDRPIDAGNAQSPTVLYNAMIAPLVPYGIRGAIWYQGESNAGRAWEYRTLFPAMIGDWRKSWGTELPFFFVQLAPFQPGRAADYPAGESDWAELREAQLYTMQTVSRTGMAVITDVGDAADIHPQQKEPVGRRLALAAQAVAYEMPVEPSGPIYRAMHIEDGRAVLEFSHLGGGLVAEGGPLKGFTACGPDHVFHPAVAEIDGDSVVVRSDAVSEIVAVRYGWADVPDVNLWNKAGLPASPFRTDDFPVTTQPK